MTSFDAALDQYRTLLKRAGEGTLTLPDINFDTGKPARPGTYRMEDEAYAAWKKKLEEKAPPTTCPSAGPNHS